MVRHLLVSIDVTGPDAATDDPDPEPPHRNTADMVRD
jgi:hypothetical protein